MSLDQVKQTVRSLVHPAYGPTFDRLSEGALKSKLKRLSHLLATKDKDEKDIKISVYLVSEILMTVYGEGEERESLS